MYFLIGSVLAGAIGIGTLVVQDIQLGSGLETVSVGMSQDDVVRILGTPSLVRACDTKGTFVAPRGPKECAEWYLYRSPFEPLLPDYPVIWFDRSKRVIYKYKYSSP